MRYSLTRFIDLCLFLFKYTFEPRLSAIALDLSEEILSAFPLNFVKKGSIGLDFREI